MRIGPFDIGPGAILAPMAGITNPPYRQICHEQGAALTPTELISSHALVYLARRPADCAKRLSRQTRALVQRYPGEDPFDVQIFGSDPAQMAEAARIIASRGASIIDLNFSCPARKVVKNGRGAGVALMLDLPKLQQIAREVVSAVEVPVTAKIRVGYSPKKRNAPEAAKRLEQAGVRAICLHGRTRDQVHAGPVDYEIMAQVCRGVSIPIIGNGGIRSADDGQKMRERTGCAAVAIAQAAKGNPWIFCEFLDAAVRPTTAQRVALCRRHLALHVDWLEDEHRAVLEMRKHACWYLKGFSGAAAFRQRLAGATTVAGFHELLDGVSSIDPT